MKIDIKNMIILESTYTMNITKSVFKKIKKTRNINIFTTLEASV